MALNYNPEDAVTAWPEDDYEAVLTKVVEKTSKVKPDGSGGNPMEVWTFDVFDANGRQQTIDDYVVIPAATFKIKQFAKAIGREQEFTRGVFQAEKYIGQRLNVSLKIEQQDGYDDKNKIAKIKGLAGGAAPRQSPQPFGGARDRIQNRPAPDNPITADAGFKDDDIPF